MEHVKHGVATLSMCLVASGFTGAGDLGGATGMRLVGRQARLESVEDEVTSHAFPSPFSLDIHFSESLTCRPRYPEPCSRRRVFEMFDGLFAYTTAGILWHTGT